MESTVVRRTDATDTRKSPGLRLEWRADGSLWALRGDEERPVSVRRCFPWTEPTRHLSLRDADEEEFALVRDPAELDARSRAALEMALAVAGFVFEVIRVLEIEEEVEIRRWRVETRQGPRTFQTRLDDWPRSLPHECCRRRPARTRAARSASRRPCPGSPASSRLTDWYRGTAWWPSPPVSTKAVR